MQITVNFKDDILKRYANQLGALGQGKAKQALQRAVDHTGTKARAAVIKTLPAQTGLKPGVIRKAVKTLKGDAGAMSFTLRTEGGNVRLKFFGAKETQSGVSAAPWGARRTYGETFMKAGWGNRWPVRRAKPNWNGQVFEREGGVTSKGKARFTNRRSDLYIPDELVSGATAAAFQGVIDRDLVPRVGREISRLLPG